MPSTKEHAPGHERIGSSALAVGLVAFYFLYALWRLDPTLMYEAQEPVFFFDPYFVKGFLTYPGGMNELCSRFYAQLFYYSWSGALALVLLFVSSAWVTRRLIRVVNPHRPVLYLHWVPSILLLGHLQQQEAGWPVYAPVPQLLRPRGAFPQAVSAAAAGPAVRKLAHDRLQYPRVYQGAGDHSPADPDPRRVIQADRQGQARSQGRPANPGKRRGDTLQVRPRELMLPTTDRKREFAP